MSSDKKPIGNACAFIKGKGPGGKNFYPRIGSAFTDDRGQISIKIDTLPLSTMDWNGWINIFPNDRPVTARAKDGGPPFTGDDDEPF